MVRRHFFRALARGAAPMGRPRQAPASCNVAPVASAGRQSYSRCRHMSVAVAARNRPRSAAAFIVLMGVVAMFGDMTYEGGRGLVGPYLALLGASATAVGFAAGFGEFLGYGLRLLTGWLGDRTRAYWPLIIGGYALNLVAVPGLALVG